MSDGYDYVTVTNTTDSPMWWTDINTEGVKMTRKRYLELAKVAEEVCTFLEKKKITKAEGCSIRKLAEEMWEMKEDK